MPRDSQLIFVGLMFAIAMAVLEMAFTDWKNEAQAHEEERCHDEPDRVAYIARKPNEAHTAEHCILVMRFGDPRWVPEFQHPLKPRQEGK